MTSWFKERTEGLPWKSVLLNGVYFSLLMSLVYLLLDHYGQRDWNGEQYLELVGWFLIGTVNRYLGWRREGHLERKNARWREQRDRP